MDDPSGGPPTADGALTWRQEHGLVNVHVFADAGYTMIPQDLGSFGTPFNSVIDPVTMEVVHWHQGYAQGANYADAEALARANAGL